MNLEETKQTSVILIKNTFLYRLIKLVAQVFRLMMYIYTSEKVVNVNIAFLGGSS